ncbi:hypothetical protein KUCAC02_036883, partial [Chaenocephalus aceratus]
VFSVGEVTRVITDRLRKHIPGTRPYVEDAMGGSDVQLAQTTYYRDSIPFSSHPLAAKARIRTPFHSFFAASQKKKEKSSLSPVKYRSKIYF